MSVRGFEREIDSVGRVVIPKQLRAEFDIEQAGSRVIITSENGQIVIRKAIASCVFCAGESNLIDFEGKKVCRDCADKLKCS